jgi:hypothetical protein
VRQIEKQLTVNSTGERGRSGKAIVKEMVGTTPTLGVITAKNGVDLEALWSRIRYLLLVLVFAWCSWFLSS